MTILVDTNHDHLASCELGEITEALDHGPFGMKSKGRPSASATAGADGIPRLGKNLAPLAELGVMETGVMDALVGRFHEGK